MRFNLKRLAEYQRKIDDLDKQMQDLARQGKRTVYRVPPLRFERLIHHELTHVLQRKFEAPDWFNEGMASWIGDDANYLCAFAAAGKKVQTIDTPPAESDESYGRGHVFWKWLASKGAAEKVARAAVLDRTGWKQAIEEATGLTWDKVVAAEQEWSAREIDKLRPKEK